MKGKGKGQDTEFLPAILEVTETPPSPASRTILWTIVILLAAVLLRSVLGHVDETAVADGKAIPVGQVKTVQVKDKGIIREIKVKEGDEVKEGDPLIVLDPTSTSADSDNIGKRVAYYELDIARLEAELNGAPFEITADERNVLDKDDIQAEQMLYNSRRGQYESEHGASQATVAQRQAAVDAARENYTKYSGMYQIALDKEQRLEQLVTENAIAEFQLLEQRSQRIELEQNVKAQEDILTQAQGELSEAQQKQRDVEQSYQKDVMSSLVDSRKQLYSLQEEQKKADQDADMTVVTAPCDGRVYNLAVHTVGGVVTDAQPLLMVVPDDAELQFEVWADNKDIGFIKPGQTARVKVETYNFQKYGVVEAEVEEVSPDASANESDRLTYGKHRLLLTIQPAMLDKFTGPQQLGPGMHVTAEVKIKEKRIIDFFLDPFRQYTSEALRER